MPSPMQINCDNRATIFIASNPVFMSILNTLSLIAILFGISSPDPRYSTSILLTRVPILSMEQMCHMSYLNKVPLSCR